MKEELIVDYDPSVWLMVDTNGSSPEEWAEAEAMQCWAETGIDDPAPEDKELLFRQLLHVATSTQDEPGFKFLYLRQPSSPGPIASVRALDALNTMEDVEKAARAITPTDTPIGVDWVETPLGKALRSHKKHSGHDKGGWFGKQASYTFEQVSFVWNLPEQQTQILLEVVLADKELEPFMEDISALAKTIHLE